MGAYSVPIATVRRDVNDLHRREVNKFDGDGATTLFILSKDNIKDGSYTVTVSSVAQVETTDFTIDKDAGSITFTSGNAPASGDDNVTVIFQYSNASDQSFLDWFNEAISKFRKKLWDEFIDESTITTTADEEEIDLSGISSEIISVIDVFYKPGASLDDAVDWSSLRTITNVRFLRRLNKLHINPHLSNSSWPLKIYGLKGYTLGTAVTDTFGPPDKFLGVYFYEVKARYYEYLANKALREMGSVTTEDSFQKPKELFALAGQMRKLGREELSKIRPVRPPKTISIVVQGGNR